MNDKKPDQLWENSKDMIRSINAHSAEVKAEQARFEKRQKLIAAEKKREATEKTILRVGVGLMLTMMVWYHLSCVRVTKIYGEPDTTKISRGNGPEPGYTTDDGKFIRFGEMAFREMPDTIRDLFSNIVEDNGRGK